MIELPPLAVYVHVPWCIKKCPYCDFNSHQLDTDIPEAQYLEVLQQDLCADLPQVQDRKVQSVFIGGGTPSLFSVWAIESLLQMLSRHLAFSDDVEITLEANPGTVEYSKFAGYHAAGINRLSLGVQSFADQQLQVLGRIHDAAQAKRAIDAIQQAGFSNWNIDLMHGLPGQSVAAAMRDLEFAIASGAPHISWYQLTIEPNTAFCSNPPQLPAEQDLFDIVEQGQALLQEKRLQQYEVSAYALGGAISRHNLNYWQFGDYLGIGAGAHAKITDQQGISRYWKTRQPQTYMKAKETKIAGQRQLANNELPMEFMLNALRLNQGFDEQLYIKRTGLSLRSCEQTLLALQERGLLERRQSQYACSPTGRRFLDDVVTAFLPAR
ncbi:MAG: radical SAM family heme chaperone HemW [Pseudomonadales bacterium]